MDTSDNMAYEKLGGRTFLLLSLRRMEFFIYYVIIFIALLVIADNFPIYSQFVYILPIGLIAGGLILLGILYVGWLEYSHYSIYLNPTDLEVKRGFVTELETGVPYRRIKQTKTERNLFDQLFGVSQVIVEILGDENDQKAEDNIITMPYLERNMAAKIQDELLRRAEVEKIVNLKSDTEKNPA